MKCLITGHKGYIGSKLHRQLLSLGHEVVGIDTVDIDSGKIQQVLSKGRKNYFVEFKPDVIFHMACQPSVDHSIHFPAATMENNVLAGSIILDYAKKNNCKKVIYSSSAAVVGNGGILESPYALHKLTTELEMQLYARLYGVHTISLRYYNVYSPDQKAKGPYSSVVSNWMEYIRKGKSPFITGTGDQTRDMLHVDDVVSANLFAMNSNNLLPGTVWDVGTGKDISLNEMRKIVLRHFPDLVFDTIPARSGEILESQADPQPLKDHGWQTQINADEGIDQCFKLLAKDLT